MNCFMFIIYSSNFIIRISGLMAFGVEPWLGRFVGIFRRILRVAKRGLQVFKKLSFISFTTESISNTVTFSAQLRKFSLASISAINDRFRI